MDVSDTEGYPGGRSPRGRGRRGIKRNQIQNDRTIPARAGTTRSCSTSPPRFADDPRAGGDDWSAGITQPSPKGRSPRGRGRRPERHVPDVLRGTIPARAGTTRPRSRTTSTRGDDPRAGGDDFAVSFTHVQHVGRSPRGRGRRHRRAHELANPRTIPARAGTTTTATARALGCGDDPRAGGDDVQPPTSDIAPRGRSPRGRGRRRPGAAGRGRPRRIPARAGTTGRGRYRSLSGEDDPRAGGDDSTCTGTTHITVGRSPRGRGRRRWSASTMWVSRTIPARAGTTT